MGLILDDNNNKVCVRGDWKCVCQERDVKGCICTQRKNSVQGSGQTGECGESTFPPRPSWPTCPISLLKQSYKPMVSLTPPLVVVVVFL